MRINKTGILKSFMVLLLSTCLLLPATIQILHLLQGHEHKACSEITTHIHDKNLECDINLFHLTHLYNELSKITLEFDHCIDERNTFYYTEHLNTSDKWFIKLRGPPFDLI